MRERGREGGSNGLGWEGGVCDVWEQEEGFQRVKRN